MSRIPHVRSVDDLEEGDLIFTSDTSYISRFIRWWGGINHSHVMVYAGDGLILESSWSGVVITGLKRYLNPNTKCVALKLPAHINREDFVRELYSRIGDQYDYGLLFGHFMGKAFNRFKSAISKHDSPTKWLCYEVIGKSLEDSGELFDTEVSELTPQLLFDYYLDGDNTWTL